MTSRHDMSDEVSIIVSDEDAKAIFRVTTSVDIAMPTQEMRDVFRRIVTDLASRNGGTT